MGDIEKITISKQKIGKNGNIINEILTNNFTEDILENENLTTKHNEDIITFTKNGFINNEGCRFFGNFNMKRIPGNFYFTVRHHINTMDKINDLIDYKFNLSHKINSLSFGYEKDLKYINDNFKIGKLNPLDNNIVIDKNEGMTHLYYMKIIPSEYYGENNKIYNVFQLTANYLSKSDSDEIPEIAFYYDISPIKITYQIIFPSNFDGIVNICAIIGGIFTIFGILNQFLLKVLQRHYKRN